MRTGSELRRALAFAGAIGLALLGAGPAASAPGDPKRKLTAADQAFAKRFVLRGSDLPRGTWHAKATDFSQANPACVVKHYSFAAFTISGQAGFTYTAGAGIPVVESDAAVFPRAAQARAAFAIESKPGLTHCLAAELVTEAAQAPGVKASVQKIEQLSFSGIAASVHGFTIVIGVKSAQSSSTLDVTFISILRGRALGSLSFVASRAPWPSASARSLTQKLASRMTAG